jgi:hypothetical protein
VKTPFQKIRERLRLIKQGFFLKKHEPSQHTLALLKALYPGIDWNRVDFYEGLPWFTPTVAPYVTAQMLPRFYSFGGYRIYLKKFDESRAQCLADIVHEAFHLLQAMHFKRGYGLGFTRLWMVHYLALFFKYGYRQNPFEIPAYEQEYRFLEYCAKHGIHGITPRVSESNFENIYRESKLVFSNIEYKYGESYLALAGGFLLCLVITVTKPIADALAYLVLWPLRYRKERI